MPKPNKKASEKQEDTLVSLLPSPLGGDGGGLYHLPVMLNECLDGLAIVPDGTYVDVTFGGGGHSRAILERLDANGRLFAFDQDEDAVKNTIDDPRFTLIQNNFRHLRKCLRVEGVKTVDGILGDLGVSSHQIDVAERGFSFRFEADLDMRMNQNEGKTAGDILNNYNAADLQRVLGEYGEVRNAKTLAQRIVEVRDTRPIRTINDFKSIVEPLIFGKPPQYLAQVFQALRIEVNDEMGALHDFLNDTVKVLSPKGRLVIMSYHSLEDRPTKNMMRHGNVTDEPIKDDFGHISKPFKLITKKPIEATAEEQKRNSRSRSAKLRIAEVLNI
jgi:16S rRNA (cytosine1402-N4)-methyltransferase